MMSPTSRTSAPGLLGSTQWASDGFFPVALAMTSMPKAWKVLDLSFSTCEMSFNCSAMRSPTSSAVVLLNASNRICSGLPSPSRSA